MKKKRSEAAERKEINKAETKKMKGEGKNEAPKTKQTKWKERNGVERKKTKWREEIYKKENKGE